MRSAIRLTLCVAVVAATFGPALASTGHDGACLDQRAAVPEATSSLTVTGARSANPDIDDAGLERTSNDVASSGVAMNTRPTRAADGDSMQAASAPDAIRAQRQQKFLEETWAPLP